jgi:multidrug efflux pump subunit AcrA (membrane-fusion protein)
VTRLFLPFVLIAGAASAACRSHASPPAPPVETVTAAVAKAALTDVPEQFEAGGVVRARITATIASRIAAPVETVTVTAGSPVRRGAPLVTLERRELDANAARARAALLAAADTMQAGDADVRAADSAVTLARLTHDRVRGLFDKRSATAQEADQAAAAIQEADARAAAARSRAAAARSARDAADATVRAAEATLSYATLTAPFDGVVAERLVDPGSLASPGTPLVIMEDGAQLRLHVIVDEFRARAIAVGQPVEARLDPESVWRAARIAEIGRVDPASHSFLVKIDLPSALGARTGFFGRARFTSGSRRVLTVPRGSLVTRGQLTFVYAVTADGLARLRPVVTGAAGGERVEIVAGLADGDTVVVSPPPALSDGSRVARRP